MKTMFLAAAAATAIVAAAPAAATNFTIDKSLSSVSLTNQSCFGINCSAGASLSTLSPFTLSTVGQSTTFNFADFVFTGVGVGSANVNATLAFSNPFATAVNSGSLSYLTFGGLVTGGALLWTNGTQTLTGTDGTQFSVRFNNLAGLTTGRTATSTVTVSLLAAAVPEPATWAMMLVGFGMVAGAARYRRRSANVTYA